MERKSLLGNPLFSSASLQNSTNDVFVSFCFCFVIFKDQFVLLKYSCICGFLLEYGLLSKVYTFRENCLPPSQQLIIESSFMARGGIMYTTPIFMLGFDLSLIFMELKNIKQKGTKFGGYGRG